MSASERSGGSHTGDAPIPVDPEAPGGPLNSSDFEAAPCGLLVLTMDGLIVRANAGFLALAGISSEKAFSSRFQQLLTRSGTIYYDTHFLPVLLLRGVLKEVAFDILLGSGARVSVLVNARVRRDLDGHAREIRLALFDASERRQYERDILQAGKEAERMAEVVRRSTDAIITLTPNGSVQGWNHGAELIFGFSQDEAMGQSLLCLIFSEEHQKDVSEAAAALEQGKDFLAETVCMHKSGREIEVSINFTPHMEAPGNLVAYSAIIRDATARRVAERALLQSEKLASVGRLASSIAHEINNPLESVTNLLYILNTQTADPGAKSLISVAQEELARVSQITTQTLRFHRQSSSRTQVEVKSLLESILALYRGRIRNSDVTAVFGHRESSALLCFDSELRQILTNLIGNAIDAMRARGGRLTLRSRDATIWSTGAKGVRITIADNGCGMDKTICGRIFEPFFTTKGISGTGLGLWVSQDLVAKNHGSIRFRTSNRNDWHGTVFLLSFPHASSHHEQPQHPPDEEYRHER